MFLLKSKILRALNSNSAKSISMILFELMFKCTKELRTKNLIFLSLLSLI
jgi:hypothetical protein